jgi:hypothetical protein
VLHDLGLLWWCEGGFSSEDGLIGLTSLSERVYNSWVLDGRAFASHKRKAEGVRRKAEGARREA